LIALLGTAKLAVEGGYQIAASVVLRVDLQSLRDRLFGSGLALGGCGRRVDGALDDKLGDTLGSALIVGGRKWSRRTGRRCAIQPRPERRDFSRKPGNGSPGLGPAVPVSSFPRVS
jgi:hypothetical protein